ncbi:hypothetical protein SUGI_0520890 [Cryptomeria japonica]|uniref:acyltransferase GLAUCE n=1 Tax=Cryptomeria japonica TaxID=3369 RepID=UPI002408CD9F|nr:acyltransferase GLAUCE [Cryptomeria japonica]GLJ26734.1 hypothetical protein SUGI_0520890 [Cryptomeria japonica]
MEEIDLNVKVGKPFLVRPAEVTQRRPFFLSNFDQNLVFTVETIHFFGCNGEEDVAQTVERALSKLLVPYDYMAGRLKLNSEQGRLEIDCNGEGALFASASCDLTIDQLPDIAYPNPAFAQFILQEYGVSSLQDLPLLFLQVTRFKCGGFALGLGTNHVLLDGIAALDLMKNLAAIAKGQGLAVQPETDRTCLKARSPLKITHTHLEFTKSSEIPPTITTPLPTSKLSFNLFPISAQMLSRLKGSAQRACSSFEALTAHLWRAHTVALDSPPDKMSTLLFAVDVRAKMIPALPKGFAGNAIFPGYARATAGELRGAELSWCVQQVQEGIARVTDEYIRSAIDWLEVYKGVFCVDRSIVVSPWKKLAFEEVEYPWGKPLYSGPIINSWIDFLLLLPNGKDDGLNVFIALEEQQMNKFRSCLYHSY